MAPAMHGRSAGRLLHRRAAGRSPRPEPPQVVASGYGRRDGRVRRTLAVADAAGVAVASVLAFAPVGWATAAWALAALPLWSVVLKGYGLYDGDIKRFSHGAVRDLPGAAHAILVGTLGLVAALHVVPAEAPGATATARFALIALAGVLAGRAAARRLLAARLGPERAVIVGDSPTVPLLARKLRAHREYGVEPVGVVADTVPAATAGLPVLGRCDAVDLAALKDAHGLDRVILARHDAGGELRGIVRAAHRLGLKVDVLADPFEAVGAAVGIEDIEGVTVFALYPPVLCRSSRALKRAMDIAGALALLVLTSPVMAAIVVAVRLDSPGPVLFRHVRIGRGGRRFTVAKFRTMQVGAEAMVDELRAQSRDPHWLLLDRDPRVTRVGRVLRRTSLDELPQLWNVLRGEMSLVGPRPLVEAEDSLITGWARGRLDLTPGLTGLWQVLGRTSIPFQEMVKLDYLYVTCWSLWGDVQLLLRTLPVLISRRGAN